MKIIARKPQPRLLQSAVSSPETPATTPPVERRTFGARLALIGIALALVLLAGGAIYWVQSERYPVVVTIAVPDRGAAGDPLANRPGPLVPIKPELLHVSSIALGNPRLTIVNGKRLAENDWLVVSTPLGDGSVRVIQIEDGVVRFRHGGETISAKLQKP